MEALFRSIVNKLHPRLSIAQNKLLSAEVITISVVLIIKLQFNRKTWVTNALFKLGSPEMLKDTNSEFAREALECPCLVEQ